MNANGTKVCECVSHAMLADNRSLMHAAYLYGDSMLVYLREIMQFRRDITSAVTRDHFNVTK